ncbi:hypothetical protein CVT26_013394 [Gymnopilus dilepis]|uniref:Uncharacterized protein n=1 Tax=Gymnopilus dilepis TaxID=231916 RepID=A0A409VV38_9AGAR|nr:hypothetical protein CVT26_013394 [Gymnopilus dilepis]
MDRATTTSPIPQASSASAAEARMEEEARSATSGHTRSSIEPGRLTQSSNATPMPPTPLLMSTSLPDLTTLHDGKPESPLSNKRQRKRKSATQEIAPVDSSSVVALGMSPFMPGQDTIFNQNRLVRNEVILARHVASLKQSYSRSESIHARRTEDIYRILTDHKNTIDRLSKSIESNSTTRSNLDLATLSNSYSTTREAIKAIIHHLTSSSTSVATSISNLDESISRLLQEDSAAPPPTEVSRPPLGNSVQEDVGSISHLHREKLLGLDELPSRGTKRRRQDLFPGFYPRLSRKISQLEEDLTPNEEYFRRSHRSVLPREVVYGPINDRLNAEGSIKEAVRNCGMSATAIESVQAALGKPGFFNIFFSKHEDARKFINSVEVGLDGHLLRRANFAHNEPLSAPASDAGSTSTSTSMTRPWLL